MSTRDSSPRHFSDKAAAQTPAKELIRNRMKMVIDQLEVILQELKEVAKELKEVVKQIDKLTSDFDFEMEPDDWTIATMSSTSSSDTTRNHDRCGPFSDYGQLGFLTPDILSDSWEFCSFLELPGETSKVEAGSDDKELPHTPSEVDYRMLNGGLIPNGPEGCAPDTSSEDTISSAPSHKALLRTSGTRERVRFSDKVLYHALCCDDDDENEEPETETTVAPTASPGAGSSESHEQAGSVAPKASSSPSASKPRHHCPPSAVPAKGNPSARKTTMRNNSTQTVSHKSTQTLLSYGSSKTQQNSKREGPK
ncbi:inhibitory synaptic factor 1-like [Stegostoma tigrinum]|uniref:inhibitory synaptic factor 1-like n=1 Tax=Stegostoma tigrinum TaxID=3053191 RepID=UPI00202B5FD2|nr:inhibitory synaptic factor 1-like [Stegostoma tigrinum]XP_059496103.1 inhibitory synaptic factor 1-like [Stegostoma tigrinum]